MGENCALQCERKCRVWQLAVGSESKNNHMHLPCLPGGGRPGEGLTGRTYQGGCRSSCTGSVRYPVEHLYAAGRMTKWFIDTKEWFWDGMFVMKTKNRTKSASYYCLPFPRPTMRLPRSSSRLVEVHHVHPPPPHEPTLTPAVSGDVAEMDAQNNQVESPQVVETSAQNNQAESSPPGGTQPPLAANESNTIVQTQSSDRNSPISQEANESKSETDPLVDQPELPRATEAEALAKSENIKSVRISHINVGDGIPQPGVLQAEKHKSLNEDFCSEFTCIDYGNSYLCPKFLRRRHCYRSTGWCPCIPAQWKFPVRRSFGSCFIRTARVCLCLSSGCANLSFCLRNIARTVDAVAATAVDVTELPSSYVFIADMPGLKYSDVKVQVENDSILKISGHREREENVAEMEVKYVLVERNSGKLMRKFNLPLNINLDGISAACQDGLLTVIIPKSPLSDAHRPRSFDVDVTSTRSVTPQ